MLPLDQLLIRHRTRELAKYWDAAYEKKVLARIPDAMQTPELKQQLSDFYQGLTGYMIGHKELLKQVGSLQSAQAMQHLSGEVLPDATQRISDLKQLTRHLTQNLDAFIYETSQPMVETHGASVARSLIGRTIYTAVRGVQKVHHRNYHIDQRAFGERLTHERSTTGFLGL